MLDQPISIDTEADAEAGRTSVEPAPRTHAEWLRVDLPRHCGVTGLDIVVAANFVGTSPRTLRRILMEEGTHWRATYDAIRRELCLIELAASQRPISEIALLLGYSETGHLTRAFRRWEGCSPREWRRARLLRSASFDAGLPKMA